MSVTVVIPSTCSRRDELRRAIESVVDQVTDDGAIVVVANGPRVDEATLAVARRFARTRVERLAEANVAKAQRVGRSLVDTEFFCFLDDDDEFLPGALAMRVAALREQPDVDVLIANGYGCADGVDRLRLDHLARAARDPLRGLVAENWMASCGGTYRTNSVSIDYFDGETQHYEWTLIAYRLALTRRIAFLDVPTFRVHLDSPGSVSKSRHFREAEVAVLNKILAMDLPSDVRRALRGKLGRAHHGLAALHLSEGQHASALRHHLGSLVAPGGLAYLAFSRKLLPLWPHGR